MKHYIGEGKLCALGFVKKGEWFVLERNVWNARKRIQERKQVGKVRLDKNGYYLESEGFELVDGVPLLFQSPACW